MKLSWQGQVRAVTFDVGGTLLEPWPSVGHVYAKVAGRHGCAGLDPGELSRRFAAVWQARGAFDYSKAGWRELVERTFAGLVDLPSPAFFGELYDLFATPAAWRIYDDVEPALRRLRAAGYKLGVISNWDERLRPLLERTGLVHFLDVIIISAEQGCAKPSPEIFRRALAQWDLPPAQVLHIGDSAHEDVGGAQKAGLHCLQLDRTAAAAKDGVISSLTAIEELLV